MGVPLGRSLPKILRHRIYSYYLPRLFLSTNNRYSRQSVGRASHTLRRRLILPTLSHCLSIGHKESHGITRGVHSSVRYRSQQKLLLPAWLTAFSRRYRYLEVGWVRIRHGLLSENIQVIRAVEISRVKNPKEEWAIHLVQCSRQLVLQFSTECHPIRGIHTDAGIGVHVTMLLA